MRPHADEEFRRDLSPQIVQAVLRGGDAFWQQRERIAVGIGFVLQRRIAPSDAHAAKLEPLPHGIDDADHRFAVRIDLVFDAIELLEQAAVRRFEHGRGLPGIDLKLLVGGPLGSFVVVEGLLAARVVFGDRGGLGGVVIGVRAAHGLLVLLAGGAVVGLETVGDLLPQTAEIFVGRFVAGQKFRLHAHFARLPLGGEPIEFSQQSALDFRRQRLVHSSRSTGFFVGSALRGVPAPTVPRGTSRSPFPTASSVPVFRRERTPWRSAKLEFTL